MSDSEIVIGHKSSAEGPWPDLLFPVGPDILFPAGLDLLFLSGSNPFYLYTLTVLTS